MEEVITVVATTETITITRDTTGNCFGGGGGVVYGVITFIFLKSKLEYRIKR